MDSFTAAAAGDVARRSCYTFDWVTNGSHVILREKRIEEENPSGAVQPGVILDNTSDSKPS
jgi:hypothetical protein